MIKKLVSLLLSALVISAAAVPAFALESQSDPTEGIIYEIQNEEVADVTDTIGEMEEFSADNSSLEQSFVSPTITYTKNGHLLKWDAFENAAYYRVYIKNGTGWQRLSDTRELFYETDALENGKEYTYAVSPYDEDGRALGVFTPNGYSAVFFNEPVLSSALLFGNSLKISWNPVENAGLYRVFVKNGNNWDVLCDTEDTFCFDRNVISGKTYKYTVAVLNEKNNEYTVSSSYDGNGVSAKFYEMPVITKTENTDSGVKITWNKSQGAVRYKLFYKNGTSWKMIADTKDTSYLHKVTTNTQYIYTVRAADANGNFISDYDHEGWSNYYLLAPVLKSIENTTEGIKISWNAQSGAQLYRIYVKNGSWTKVADTRNTYYTDKNVVSGKKYTYTVRCLSNDAKAFTSSFSKTGISIDYVAAPSVKSIENKNDGAHITWGKQNGAAKYRVFVKNGTSWKSLGDTASTTFIHKNLSNGSVYTYTVRALNTSGKFVSAYNKEGYKNTYLVAPKLKNAAASGNGIKVTWDAVNKAEKYRIYSKSGNDSWKQIGNTEDTFFIDNTVNSGQTYTYTVRCISKNGKSLTSDFDHTGISIRYIAAPRITKIENQTSSVKVTWGLVNGAAKYRLFFKNGTSWKAIGDTASSSLVHTGVKNGNEYIYTVRALDKNSKFISGFDSNGWKNVFIEPPVIRSITMSGRNMLLGWNKNANAKGYRVYRKNFGSSWTKIADVNTNSYIDTSYPSNIPYTYTLRCLDADGNLISSFKSDTLYYYKGELANGKITVNGTSYVFVAGLMRQGYITVNGATYYYDSEGTLVKNGIVGNAKDGYRYADKNGKVDMSYCGAVTSNGSEWNVVNGKATKVTSEYDKTLNRALKLLAKITTSNMTKEQKLRKAYDHVKTAYNEYNPRIPHFHGDNWHLIYANDIFVGGGGNCISYGAAFAFLAKAIGYTDVACCNSGGHGWAEINGKAYDPEWEKHHTSYSYFGVGYHDTDVNYGNIHYAGAPSWMVVKI